MPGKKPDGTAERVGTWLHRIGPGERVLIIVAILTLVCAIYLGIAPSQHWPPFDATAPAVPVLIRVIEASGPGAGEASGADAADRIFSECAAVEVAYSFGSQGAYHHDQPFHIAAGEIRLAEAPSSSGVGVLWHDTQPTSLPFYPQRDERDVLHNDKVRLDYAKCTNGVPSTFSVTPEASPS